MDASERLAWPVMLILLMVLVPSVGVVWLMREAVRNERLAARQMLQDAYQSQLEVASGSVLEQWKDWSATDRDARNSAAPVQTFASLISAAIVDGAIIRDSDGTVLYPKSAVSEVDVWSPDDPVWIEAKRLEFQAQHHAEAAKMYASLAESDPASITAAMARQATIRCLIKLGKQEPALKLLRVQQSYPSLIDPWGRSFAAAAELRMLELLPDLAPERQKVVSDLSTRLATYRDPPMASTQRIFLMSQVERLTKETHNWPNRDIEQLSLAVLETTNTFRGDGFLHLAGLPNVWYRTSRDNRVVALYRTETLKRRLQDLAATVPLPRGSQLVATEPQAISKTLVEKSLGEALGGWRIGLSLATTDAYEQTHTDRRAIHVWIASLIIGCTLVLAWLLSGVLRRRLRLAQIKNDLVATVSHELKTPLASIRLLVDTLLLSNAQDHDQTCQYLQLISHENARLTRLIENFLTFSNSETNRSRTRFEPIDLRDVAERSLAVFEEHFGQTGSAINFVDGDPVFVRADGDRIATAIVNLLENAWKYSDAPRTIDLKIDTDDQWAALSVSDNGMGMTARQSVRVFDRFYQVDQRVSRIRGGCGLGLCIVKAIMTDHGGTVAVHSQLNVGSTFTLRLPRCPKINDETQNSYPAESER